MENYIVRIYRRTSNRPEKLVGLVEKPDSGENWKFGTIEELCDILVRCETIAGPTSPKQTIEQRRYRRFIIKEGSLIFDSRSLIGAVRDISMGGLAVTCLDALELPGTLKEAGAFRCEDGFCTEALPCRLLPDHEVSDRTSFDRMERTRCRVEFEELSPGQKMQLLYIIHNYTENGE